VLIERLRRDLGDDVDEKSQLHNFATVLSCHESLTVSDIVSLCVWHKKARQRDRGAKPMALAVLGILILLLLAATALRYFITRPLNRYDRIGALVFFIVIGLPVFVVGLDLISQSTATVMSALGH